MIRADPSTRRKLSFTEQELAELADEFATYAAEDIADLLGADFDERTLCAVAMEVAHALRCVLDELPQSRTSPAFAVRHAAAELVSSEPLVRLIHHQEVPD